MGSVPGAVATGSQSTRLSKDWDDDDPVATATGTDLTIDKSTEIERLSEPG